MTEQWRAGLRVSGALALEVADLSLDADLPPIRVHSGKGRKSRIVPVHPELRAAFSMALAYGNVSEGRIIDVHRSTAWRWVQKAVERAEQLGAKPLGHEVALIPSVTVTHATCCWTASLSTTCFDGSGTARFRRRSYTWSLCRTRRGVLRWCRDF